MLGFSPLASGPIAYAPSTTPAFSLIVRSFSALTITLGISTPFEHSLRTYRRVYVLQEVRKLTVPSEARYSVVLPELRAIVVPSEARDSVVLPELRHVVVTPQNRLRIVPFERRSVAYRGISDVIIVEPRPEISTI